MKELKNDKEVVLEAIKNNQLTLVHASEEIRSLLKKNEKMDPVQFLSFLIGKENTEKEKVILKNQKVVFKNHKIKIL